MKPAVTSGGVRTVKGLHSPDRQHSQTMDLSSLPVEVIAAILAHVPIKVSRTILLMVHNCITPNLHLPGRIYTA